MARIEEHLKRLVWTGTLCLACTASAPAQRPFGMHGWGPRAGITVNPDQVHVGVHFDLGDLAPRLLFLPQVELGAGDGITTLAPTFELDYRFRRDWGSWNPYLGGGIGPVFFFRDRRDNTELGVAVQGGIARRLSRRAGAMFIEFKLGLANYPDARFTLGWIFGRAHGPQARSTRR